MLDPSLFRSENLAIIARKLREVHRASLDVEKIRELEATRKAFQIKLQDAQNVRNQIAKQIANMKATGTDEKNISEKLSYAQKINQEITQHQTILSQCKKSLDGILLEVPNIPDASVPIGEDEHANVVINEVGKKRAFDFSVKDHVDLGHELGMLDFESASQMACSRFVVMQGVVAQLHRALVQFMLDTHIREHGYREVNVPYLVNATSLQGTGQLPKFKKDLFWVEAQDLYLIPTAEVPVTNLMANKIIAASDLPKKFVCHTACFRSEAGAYGRDTRGMIRQHQFEKVELVQFTQPEHSYDALEALTGHAEKILQYLELPYRKVALSSGDLGFSAAKTYDLEVWLPSQACYREISSCSNFESFQARRMKARWRNPTAKKPEYLHTLNGSGLAVGRTLIAILENYQQSDGSIVIPPVLRNFMHGQEKINSTNATC